MLLIMNCRRVDEHEEEATCENDENKSQKPYFATRALEQQFDEWLAAVFEIAASLEPPFARIGAENGKKPT